MNSNIGQEINLFREFLDRENEIGILIGSHQNLDTYAASLALYLSLVQSGKKVQIVSKKAPTVEVSSLVGIDKVKSNFAAGNNSKLVVALPYIKGEVEKVLFTEAPDTINFHLTAAPDKSITPFDISDVKLIWEGGAPNALIAVGVGSMDEIVSTADPNTVKVVNIDNFSGNSKFGDVVLVDENFSSLSEVIGKIIKDLALPMDIDIAQNIMDGVMFGTRGFTKSNTSPFAFEAVSAAMYQGAQRKGENIQREQNVHERPQHQDRPMQSRPQPRVNENDFPAMHMQNRGTSQQRNPIIPQRNQQPQARPQNMQNRLAHPHSQPQGQRQQPQFGQNARDIEDLLRKINEENARRNASQSHQNRNDRSNMPQAPRENRQQYNQNPIIEDAQVVEDVKGIPDDMMPPQEDSYQPQRNEEVPDDWLMPKVFKSSKNNN